MKFKKPIEVQAGISDGDPTNPLGQAGYLLSSDGSNVNWVSPGGLSAETAEAIVQPIKANEALVKGDPVYIVGFNNGQNTNIVAKADSSDPTKMPVVGLVDDDYANQAFGTMTAFGSFNGAFDTSGGTEGWSVGDIIFVKPLGGLTNIKPGGTDLIQNVAIVSRVSTQTGELEVIALGRTNDVPNLPTGRLFVGTAANTSLASDVVYVDDANNRVGIRTAFPQVAFHVDGAIRVIGDLQVSQQNNNTFVGENMTDLTVITGSNNTALGDSVMPGATSASFNTGIGALSLNAFVTGNNNTAVGAESMKLSNGASFNTAIGTGSLKAATLGQGNTAIGFSALAETTTTNFNTAVGNNCLGNITTGFRNTAVGNDAGKFIADGATPNSTGNQSIFIGDSAKALANAQNNQIVIGYDAIGNGANTATIGNSSIVKTILKGNVGIGTTSPGSKLQVDGEIDANGGDGYRINGRPWAAESSGNLRLGDWDGEGFTTSIFDDNSAEVVTIGNYGTMINCSSLTSSYGANASLAVGTAGATSSGAAVVTLSNGDTTSSAGDVTGIIQFAIKDDNGSLGYTSASIQGSISQAAGSGNGGGGILDFYTAPWGTGNSPQLRMRIKDSGNVGIGTTSPGSILHLEDTTPTLKILSNQFYNNSVISMGNGQSEAVSITCSNNPGLSNLELKYDNGAFGDARIRVGQRNLDFMIDGGSAVYINSSKNVGIGTTGPSSKLQVNGGVQLANDTASPSATKVGTFRYRTSGNNSFVDMCMQTGASTYAWVNIVTNNW